MLPQQGWQRLELSVPITKGENTKAFINADKPPEVARVKKLSNILFKICRPEFADKKFSLDLGIPPLFHSSEISAEVGAATMAIGVQPHLIVPVALSR